MNRADFRKAAEEIADTLVCKSSGPLLTREDGLKFVEAYLRSISPMPQQQAFAF